MTIGSMSLCPHPAGEETGLGGEGSALPRAGVSALPFVPFCLGWGRGALCLGWLWEGKRRVDRQGEGSTLDFLLWPGDQRLVSGAPPPSQTHAVLSAFVTWPPTFLPVGPDPPALFMLLFSFLPACGLCFVPGQDQAGAWHVGEGWAPTILTLSRKHHCE